jgi:nucleoside-diphosphate-sugar epimerase
MVYGNPNKINVKESFYLQPKSSYYASSKISCEHLLYKISSKNKMTVINLRISGILNSKENLMFKIKENLKKNKDIKLYGGKNLYRDYLHTDDLEKVLKLIYKKKFEKSKTFIYNFSSFQNRTIYELVLIMKRYLKSKSKILILNNPPIRENFSMNIKKIKKELKFRNTSLEKMMSKFSYEK